MATTPGTIHLKIELPIYTRLSDGPLIEIGTITFDDDFPVTTLEAAGAHATFSVGQPVVETVDLSGWKKGEPIESNVETTEEIIEGFPPGTVVRDREYREHGRGEDMLWHAMSTGRRRTSIGLVRECGPLQFVGAP